MKDIVLDLVKHTATLPFVEQLKVEGSDTETTLYSIDNDRTVVLYGNFHNPVPEFEGAFGMGNLNFLKGISDLAVSRDKNAEFSLKTRERNGETEPESIVVKSSGNKDTYRLMSGKMIDTLMKKVTFSGKTWTVEFKPTKENVDEFAQASSIYGGVSQAFTVSTENGNLVFSYGSADTGLSGKHIFARDITGELKSNWSWQIDKILPVLKLGMTGECTMRITDQGALNIEIDSGLASYSYIFPAYQGV